MGDPPAPAFGRDPGGGRLVALGGIEVGGDLGLERLGRALEDFEGAEGVDALGVGPGTPATARAWVSSRIPSSNMCSIVLLSATLVNGVWSTFPVNYRG